jgi:ubiquinone/menaquinone biosynthesis C-methylase UbiE
MAHVCPWWSAWFTIDNPVRRLLHDPEKIVGPYVRPGMTVLDVGCGRGWFTIPLARMVGSQGRVIAVDIQQQMLDVLQRRAEKAALADRIEIHKCRQDQLGVAAGLDFALAFAMVHEAPDQHRLLGEIYACLKPGGRLLVAEPRMHVPGRAFGRSVATAEELGFRVAQEPRVRWCRAVLLERPAAARGIQG